LDRGNAKEYLCSILDWGFSFRDLSSCRFAKDIDVNLLRKLSFDETTVFPKELPQGYEPKTMLSETQHVGLNIEQLHARGYHRERC